MYKSSTFLLKYVRLSGGFIVNLEGSIMFPKLQDEGLKPNVDTTVTLLELLLMTIPLTIRGNLFSCAYRVRRQAEDSLCTDVQRVRDIGFHCHAPYTNSEEPAQSQHRLSRALSNASSRFMY